MLRGSSRLRAYYCVLFGLSLGTGMPPPPSVTVASLGRPVQVDPIKFTLKAAGTLEQALGTEIL